MALDKKCIITACPNMGRKRSEFCATCGSAFHYWEKKLDKHGIQAIHDRQRALDKWTERMTYLGNRDKEYSNVTRFFKRRG